MALALGALGGLGFPEVFVLLFIWALPAIILWKFYRALTRIGDELEDIKEILHQGRAPSA